jgi:hypothetical protein
MGVKYGNRMKYFEMIVLIEESLVIHFFHSVLVEFTLNERLMHLTLCLLQHVIQRTRREAFWTSHTLPQGSWYSHSCPVLLIVPPTPEFWQGPEEKIFNFWHVSTQWAGVALSNTCLGGLRFISYPEHRLSDRGFSWFSSGRLGNFRDITSIKSRLPSSKSFQINLHLSSLQSTLDYRLCLLWGSKSNHNKKKPTNTLTTYVKMYAGVIAYLLVVQ